MIHTLLTKWQTKSCIRNVFNQSSRTRPFFRFNKDISIYQSTIFFSAIHCNLFRSSDYFIAILTWCQFVCWITFCSDYHKKVIRNNLIFMEFWTSSVLRGWIIYQCSKQTDDDNDDEDHYVIKIEIVWANLHAQFLESVSIAMRLNFEFHNFLIMLQCSMNIVHWCRERNNSHEFRL